MILEKDSIYQADVNLSTIESFAANAMIETKLREAGFTDVSVTGTGKKRLAKGRWSKPTQQAGIPSQLSNVIKV